MMGIMRERMSAASARITGFSAQLQRRRRGVSVKIFTWQAGVRATFTLKHVLRKLARMFGDEGRLHAHRMQAKSARRRWWLMACRTNSMRTS